jgi:hypothetical protein
VVTNFEVQARAAQEALEDARRRVRTQPAAAIEALQEVAVAYPFVDRVRTEALRLAGETEATTRARVDAYAAALDAFRVFRSREALEALERQDQEMAALFPAGAGTSGALDARVREIAETSAQVRGAWYAEHAATELGRLERLGDLLAAAEGYAPMAAVYFRTIVERYGHLAGDDAFGRRITRARERYEALREEYGPAIPDLPKPK